MNREKFEGQKGYQIYREWFMYIGFCCVVDKDLSRIDLDLDLDIYVAEANRWL